MLGRFLATWLYGTPLAVDPRWLAAHKAEAQARAQHKATRVYQLAKREALHRALGAGR